MKNKLTKPFILLLVVLSILACFFIFRPFLVELFVAAVLVSVFYAPYRGLTEKLGGRRQLAALFMCLILLLVIVVPTVKILLSAGNYSINAYNETATFFSDHSMAEVFKAPIFKHTILWDVNLARYENNGLKNVALELVKNSSAWMLSGAAMIVEKTTQFLISIVMIIITMFFFFVDGKKIMEKLMYWSPLPNRYDMEIFRKFRSVSYTTFISTFVVALAQGAVGAIGFAIVGFPALLAGVLVAILSLLPYIGSMIFYIPAGIYYLLIGSVWQGIFILLWGFLVIGTVDNVIRTWMIRGKAEVNPIFILFSILGGISLFGFWGVVIGPLVVAIAVTILHIYELEYCNDLESVTEAQEKAVRVEKDRVNSRKVKIS